MNWYSTTGRAMLVRALMAKGMSVREAEKVVNAIFAAMSGALRRGEDVETPLGMFLVKRQRGKRRQELHRFRNVNTGKTQSRLVRYPVFQLRYQPGLRPHSGCGGAIT